MLVSGPPRGGFAGWPGGCRGGLLCFTVRLLRSIHFTCLFASRRFSVLSLVVFRLFLRSLLRWCVQQITACKRLQFISLFCLTKRILTDLTFPQLQATCQQIFQRTLNLRCLPTWRFCQRWLPLSLRRCKQQWPLNGKG